MANGLETDAPAGAIAVFVYGTLRRGQVNHGWLAESRFGGCLRLPGVRLHDLGPFPMAIAGPDTADWHVEGELWWVDAATLARLDRLEGHPRLYERRRLPLENGQQAWVYLGRPRQVRHVPALPQGRWPAAARAGLALALAALGAWAAAGPPGSAQAEVAGCQAWQRSHGAERIRIGNSLGLAHYLTRNRLGATSPEDAPVSLYRESDLRHLCDGR